MQATDPMQAVEEMEEEMVSDVEEVEETKEPTVESLGKKTQLVETASNKKTWVQWKPRILIIFRRPPD